MTPESFDTTSLAPPRRPVRAERFVARVRFRKKPPAIRSVRADQEHGRAPERGVLLVTGTLARWAGPRNAPSEQRAAKLGRVPDPLRDQGERGEDRRREGVGQEECRARAGAPQRTRRGE